ncbi:2-phospho-L-lactate transferase CofD family protein [Aeromicrobium marinum]|uniref:2-phospho-L-lactate transferase CofD family protein n=1 Tax=Aeromicrobium marinum TaxID=219314 RepID=UPI00058F4A48|nr:2-phospho-L-lactate transferase CofD family protein [Aeromicrobium marinum]
MHLVLIAGAAGADLATNLRAALGDGGRMTVVAPTTRDAWVAGLKRCPDLDAHLRVDGPGSHGVADALEGLGFAAGWQRADDSEMALRIVRTELLHAGFSLTEATRALAARSGATVDLLPLSDDRGEWHRVVDGPDGRRAVHVDEHGDAQGEEPWVLVHDTWTVSPAVLAAVDEADAVLVHGPASARGHLLDHAVSAVVGERPGLAPVATGDHPPTDILRAVGALS